MIQGLPLLVPVLGDAVRRVLDSVFPDPAQRAEAELRLRQLEQEGTFEQKAALALAQGQIATNQAEAAGGWWRAGWRPAAGWVCVFALAFEFVIAPLGSWGLAIAGHPVPAPPRLDAVLFELLFGLLGLGALRSFDKLRGRA